jgi:uridylate kinase
LKSARLTEGNQLELFVHLVADLGAHGIDDAVALMRDSNIPIVVFSIKGRGNLLTVLRGEGTHTVVAEDRAA